MDILKEAINKIFELEYSSLSFEEFYRNSYHLVLHKFGQFLYDGVSTSIKVNLEPMSFSLIQSNHSQLLPKVKKCWLVFKTFMLVIRIF
jgi:hypothetical protein